MVGIRQVFVRFSGCNLACMYCDTEGSGTPGTAMMEKVPGRREFLSVPNPIGLDRVMETLQNWNAEWPGIHHSLSITGGEPLLHQDILHEWLPHLRGIFPIYLETNGVLQCALFSLIAHLDFISMDIKLPSTSGCTLWDEHAAFLATAAEKKVFVKCVISSETEEWEIVKTCNIIRNVDEKISLILQPVTLRNGTIGIQPLKLLELQETACRFLSDVRVIPQTHRFVGLL